MTNLEDTLTDEKRQEIKNAARKSEEEKERAERMARRKKTKYGSMIRD